MFQVAARTLLELGADLISSDAVAIYELVKNGIDARSTTGVTVEFSIALRHSDYVDALTRAADLHRRSLDESAMAAHLDEIKTFVGERIVPSAPSAARENIVKALETATTPEVLGANLRAAYVESNVIEFRDTGHGMSHADLSTAYLRDEALKNARITFLRAIRTLDLADYANLQELTVKAEHARMGDYVIDLYDLHLRSVVESDENLVRAAASLNTVAWGTRAPGQFMPSPEVVAMMDGAMFYHEVRTRLGHEGAAVAVRLGDVLLGPMVATGTDPAAGTPQERRDVYVVISQECDQQHGDVDRVLLLQGVAYPYSWRQHGKAKAARPRTPVMFVGQAKFTIEWNLLQPETWLMAEVTRRLNECGYQVVRRFRTPFALALQQAFSGRLNRVGTLAAPPARFAAKVRIYVRTHSGEAFLITEAASTDEHAVCLVGRTEKDLKEWLLLSDKFHAEFRAKLSEIEPGVLPQVVLSARDDPEFYRILRAGLEFARDDRDGFRPLKDTNHNILQVFTSPRIVAGEQWPQTVKLPLVIEIEAE